MRALVVVAVLAVAAAARADGPPPEVAAARARQLAELFRIEPLLQRIAHAPSGGGLDATLERLQLRDDSLAELQRVSLLIDATVARIDQEHAATATAQSFVEERYTRAVTGWNIAALIVGNSLSIAGTALQFDGQTQAWVGDGIILGGAALATAFSIVALTRRNRGRPPHAVETNFLAPLFDRAPTADSRLPEPVWRYLDTPLAGEPASLRQQLLERWARQGSVPRQPSPATQRRLDLLTEPLPRAEAVPADVLDDRADMLADLRARIAGMRVDVEALVREVAGSAGR